MGDFSQEVTFPEGLNVFCMYYPEKLYNMLFFSSKETLLTFGKDGKYLGAGMGCISILHTWGQNLSLHPHVHIIVSAGGIDDNGKWKNTRDEGKFLFPVKALSSVYRGKFMALFQQFLIAEGMELMSGLREELYRKDWVVFAKRPFGGAGQVIEYLGRYTHKIAISNHRLKSIDGDRVKIQKNKTGWCETTTCFHKSFLLSPVCSS